MLINNLNPKQESLSSNLHDSLLSLLQSWFLNEIPFMLGGQTGYSNRTISIIDAHDLKIQAFYIVSSLEKIAKNWLTKVPNDFGDVLLSGEFGHRVCHLPRNCQNLRGDICNKSFNKSFWKFVL